VIIGLDTLPPDTNLVYRLPLLTNYDAIWIGRYDRLYKELFAKNTNNWRGSNTFTERGLKLFGVEFVLPPFDPTGDPDLLSTQLLALNSVATGEIGPQTEVTQTFKAHQNQLRAVSVMLATYGRKNTCNLGIGLEEVSSNAVITKQTFSCADLHDSFATISFAPLANSAGKTYRIVISSPDGMPGNAVTAWTRADLQYPEGTLNVGANEWPGGLIFNIFYDQAPAFHPVTQLDQRTLYHYDRTLTKYYTVSSGVAAQSEDAAWQLIQQPEFDPAQVVVLEGAPAPRTTPAAHGQASALPVRVLREEATAIRLFAQRNTPGYLVLTKPYYLGWKAKVNGAAVPVMRANYAFSAIPLPAGASTIEFYYDPVSFHVGLAVTLCSLVLGLFLIAKEVRNSHRFDRREKTVR
jgi:hypothetical protein